MRSHRYAIDLDLSVRQSRTLVGLLQINAPAPRATDEVLRSKPPTAVQVESFASPGKLGLAFRA